MFGFGAVKGTRVVGSGQGTGLEPDQTGFECELCHFTAVSGRVISPPQACFPSALGMLMIRRHPPEVTAGPFQRAT